MDNDKPLEVTLRWQSSTMTWCLEDNGMALYKGVFPAISKEHDITDILAKKYNVKIKRIVVC